MKANMRPVAHRLLKLVFIAILIFSVYHLVRDVAQTFDWHTSFSDVGHRSHEWCGQYCDVVTYPLDIAGIIIPIIVLKRNRVGKLGIALLAAMPLWFVFTLLP